MDEQIKLHWKLYEEYYTNNELLKNFNNLMDVYHPQKKGKIIDIGCGQSGYLIDFCKNSDHQLYAIDKEPIQINALKRRIEKIKIKSQIEFYTNEFPTKELSTVIFSGVIVSNLLHFMSLKQAEQFIGKIEKQITQGSILLFTAHSWRHRSNGNFNYFKHYFRKKDFYQLLPKRKYDYLYFDQKTASKNERNISFIKKWIKAWYNRNNIFDDDRISKEQENYLNKSNNVENYTIVVRRK